MKTAYREVINHDWLAKRSVLLSYEEMTQDPTFWMREHICPMLGIECVPPVTRMQKQNTKPLSATIINYRDVADFVPECRQIHRAA
jgi:hypothetical protein